MQVGVVGINHKLAELELREKLAFAALKRFEQAGLALNQCVLLSTCNRTEIYFSSSELAATHTQILASLREEIRSEFEQKLYSFFGIDCFSHLCRVAAGLDSAILAETEIQGQVKGAYEAARIDRLLAPELHYVFQKSLSIAKKIRTDLHLGRGLPNLAQTLWEEGSYFFQKNQAPKILFAGASEINYKILSFFKKKHYGEMFLCNRTFSKAQSIGDSLGIQVLEWNILKEWNRFDWIIFGTKSPKYLLLKENLPIALDGYKLIFDLSFPRNVEDKVGQHPQIKLFNIDQMNAAVQVRSHQIHRSLSKAEQWIQNLTRQHSAIFDERIKAIA